jgi:hypothetical protein
MSPGSVHGFAFSPGPWLLVGAMAAALVVPVPAFAQQVLPQQPPVDLAPVDLAPEGALPCPEIDLFFDDNEQVREKRTDSNGDCRADQVVHYAAGLPQRALQDRDHDGRMDSWLSYGEDGALIREARDRVGDGQADTWTEISGPHPSERREDHNADGEADVVIEYVKGEPVRQREDSNLDGQPDRFTRFEGGVARSIEQDRNHDGNIDAQAEFDAQGKKSAERQDENHDGAFEITILYRAGVRERVEEDTRGDGRPDVVVIYSADAGSASGDEAPAIARREVDSDGDGRFESVARFDGGIERTRQIDADGDGFAEVMAWLLPGGQLERETIDSDASGRHDVTRHYTEGRRVRDERDADGDGQPERITLYSTEVPDQIIEEKADTSKDGQFDTRVVYRQGLKYEQFEDRNADGETDARYRFDPEERIVFETVDADGDGRFESEADFTEGTIQQRRVDSTGAGKPDRIEFYRGGELIRVERDSNQDGQFEAWVFYDESGGLARREEDTDADGRVDRWLSFGPDSPEAILVETDTRGDGVPDTWRIANAKGQPQRLEEDRNGDHRVDYWVHFEGDAPARYEQDRDFDGRLDARGDLDADGNPRQNELDTTGDARFDLRQTFAGGILILEERDTRTDGNHDGVTHFEDGVRVRQEIDSNGDGRFDTLVLFTADRAVEQRRDTRGDGHFDQTVHLDERGMPAREEFDTDGDQIIDLVRDYLPAPEGAFSGTEDSGTKNSSTKNSSTNDPGTKNPISKNPIARESVDADGDGRFEQLSVYKGGQIVRTETDADGDGQAEDVIEYREGQAIRRSQDPSGRGQPDRIIHYSPRPAPSSAPGSEPVPVRIEEDTSGDGRFDTVLFFENGVHRRSERDQDGNGAPDIWIFNDESGQILRREEDRSGDGGADFVVHFREGVARRVEIRRPPSAGQKPGCIEVTSWLNKHGDVIAEEKDTHGDCRMDTWSYYASGGGDGGRLTRQARDSDFDGRADLLVSFDSQRRIRSQELAGPDGRPNKKIFLDASGSEERQCLDSSGDGRFDLVLFREGDVLRETWLVSQPGQASDPRADQRDIYKDGQRVRVEIDTRGQGRPDVVQYLDADERVVRQDEDSNHDGRLDLRFENDQPVPVANPPEAPPALQKLDCGGFDRFWDSH